ncbi:MAG: hypothetical protein H6538_00940 [Bacteroidales bacterium]|nr:hypothetical protein [Bacteroidales bacterium]MCB8999941.1 hypothetical protein [Bacteroidales bacterium]MCB9012608.1 hypothetical protein [Bacteroidales bacterium]
MLRKLLWQSYGKLQMAGATAGSLIGFVLLISISQFWFEMDHVLKTNEDLINPDFIVINKKVSILKTLDVGNTDFTEGEMENIRKQPFADQVAGFISNDFALSAYTESERFPDFYTDLFFEAVPDTFLDVKTADWKWEAGQSTIPIILPQDYLNLYNFGFAPSQGLPQISPSIIRHVNFKISITGKGKQTIFNGKIVGFSNRINSILVPYKFLNWANKEYGKSPEPKISRAVIVSKNPSNPEIAAFLNREGYESIKENLKSSRLNIILKFIISFLGGLGILIIGLALLVFILSFQLLISKSGDKIRKLSLLGYHYREISRPYIYLLSILISLITLLAGFSVLLLKRFFINFSGDWGLELTPGIHPLVAGGGIILLALIFVLNYLAISRQTRRFSESG